ncbi:MAG: hypothetical protein ACYDCK_00470 [Thermoplasmatota archaeon]
MKNRIAVLFAVGLLAALPMAGCIENINSLKDKLGKSSTTTTTPTPVTQTQTPVTNSTNMSAPPLKPPVARISVFAENGALVYKSSFIAENVTATPIEAMPGNLTFLGADSETDNGGATLTGYKWSIDGMKMDGRKVVMSLTSPGIHMVELVVTDSKGASDGQMIHLGIQPIPFVVTKTYTGTLTIGDEDTLESSGTPAASTMQQQSESTVAFPIETTINGKTVTAQHIALDLTNPNGYSLDYQMSIYGPDGKLVKTVHDNGPLGNSATAEETYAADNPAIGNYKVVVEDMLSAPQPDYAMKVSITYVEVVAGLPANSMAGMVM